MPPPAPATESTRTRYHREPGTGQSSANRTWEAIPQPNGDPPNPTAIPQPNGDPPNPTAIPQHKGDPSTQYK